MNLRISVLLFLLLQFFLVVNVHAGIDWSGTELPSGQETGMKVGLFTTADSPHGHKNTSLSVQVQVSRAEKGQFDGSITVLILHSSDLASIGYEDPETQKRHMCCTKADKEKSRCVKNAKPGDVIIHGSTLKPNIHKLKASQTTSKQESYSFDVQKSGVHYVYFINCQDNAIGDVVLNNTKIEWENPFGKLPGDQYYFLPFYGSLSILYSVLALVWFILSAIHWREILPIQNCIAGVIALGMMECATWYFEYLNYNMTGIYHIGAIVIGILVSTSKRTLSRLLVLVVSMGFGVVKADLGTTRYKVLFLGELYFIFAGALHILSGNTSAEGLTTMLIIPVALLDTFFYWWIFLSLARTISQLSIRKQPIKLSMYKHLFVVLVLSGVCSSLVVIYQLFVVATSNVDDRWRTWWIWEAFWHVLYFFVLTALAFFWRPTANNTRYALVELKDEDGEDEENGISLVPMISSLGEMSQRARFSSFSEDDPSKFADGAYSPDTEKLAPSSSDNRPSIVPAFTLDEDEDSQVEASKLN